MLTSSTQLQKRSFHVIERTRTSSKCQKMKNARAKRAKILFSIVQYTNLWGFCCRRGCEELIVFLQIWKPQFLSVVQFPFDNCHSPFSPTTFFEIGVRVTKIEDPQTRSNWISWGSIIIIDNYSAHDIMRNIAASLDLS